MTDLETRQEPPAPAPKAAARYGGFYKPKAWGVFGLGPIGSGLAAVTAVAAVLVMMSPLGLWGSVTILVVVGSLLYLASHPDRHGKNWFQRAGVRRGHKGRARAGSNLYLPGTLTKLGAHKLPGVLASSTLTQYQDSDGQPFAVLRYPSRGHHVVSFRAHPDGAVALDSEVVTRQVNAWADWIAALAHEEALVQGIVTIETSPNGGPLMRRAITARESDRAHSLSKEWMNDVLDQYPRGSQGVEATITLTVRTPPPDVALDGSKIPRRDQLDTDEMVGQRLAARVPHVMQELAATGAGAVELMTPDDVIETVRCAYDPAARGVYDGARATGAQPPVSLWSTVGPSGAVAEWGYYRHGDRVSVTWEFTSFTTSAMTVQSLLPLLEANDDVEIKRVTIIYRPLPADRSSQIVESNHQAAEARLGDAKKPTARQKRAVRDADQARSSEAEGYAVCDVAVLVTATVTDDKLAKAHAAVSRLGPTARLHLRPMNGLQDVGFAAAIGVLGLDIESYLALPPALMNGV